MDSVDISPGRRMLCPPPPPPVTKLKSISHVSSPARHQSTLDRHMKMTINETPMRHKRQRSSTREEDEPYQPTTRMRHDDDNRYHRSSHDYDPSHHRDDDRHRRLSPARSDRLVGPYDGEFDENRPIEFERELMTSPTNRSARSEYRTYGRDNDSAYHHRRSATASTPSIGLTPDSNRSLPDLPHSYPSRQSLHGAIYGSHTDAGDRDSVIHTPRRRFEPATPNARTPHQQAYTPQHTKRNRTNR